MRPPYPMFGIGGINQMLRQEGPAMSAFPNKSKTSSPSLGCGMISRSNEEVTVSQGSTAYIDESMRMYDGSTTYYLCAAIDHGIDDDAVAALTSLVPNGAKKLHWRDMGEKLQEQSLIQIGMFDMSVIIVSGRPVGKQERARRKCLELLLPLLGSAGVSRVIMESRSGVQDKRDREMAVSLIRKGWLGDVTVTHQRGEEEPKLWIPDQILGAQGHVDARGISEIWGHAWRRIEKSVERREIAL